MGIEKWRISSYNPNTNGLIENFQRPLKAAIMAHKIRSWTEDLSTILLGFTCALKKDTDATPSELVYGTTSRLFGNFYNPCVKINDLRLYVEKLCEHIR